MDEVGHFTTSGELAELLEEHHAWAMLLDEKGTVIFQKCMPEELPRQYTPADVAKFSRWYLGDYPVYVQEHPQGLLVVGGEKGSQAKYYFSVNESYVKNLFTGLIAVFLANIIVVVLLIWKNIRHVEKAVTPILRGIETISSGQPVNLPEKGELAEINRQLNKAGAFIVKKDNARADWISGISHDVRTPLSVILGFAGQLEDNQTLPAPAREQAACIRKQGENHTVITVSDNGIGVTAEMLEKLNANTHRIESTDERLNLRHGLGILPVRQIVEAHHGTMEIFSEQQIGYKTVLTFSNGGI